MNGSPPARDIPGREPAGKVIDLDTARRRRSSLWLPPDGQENPPSEAGNSAETPSREMDLFNVITWNMEEGVCTLDPRGRVSYLNPAAERALGWSCADLCGRDFHAAVHGHNGGSCHVNGCEFDDALAGGRKLSGETRMTRRDGTSFPVSINLSMLGRQPGRSRGAVIVFSDISGTKQNEEHLRRTREQTERLEALEHAKSQFLNLASHELRGPLAVVRGYISMIEDGTLGELSPELLSVVPILSSKLRQMDMLVNDMLETSRLEDSRMQLDLEQLDLRDAVQSAVRALEPISPIHRLKIHLDRRMVPVRADPTRLGNILTNLVDNAVKYSPAGGDVVCRVGTQDGMAAFSVSDQGIGISPEHLGRLFTRFGRVVTRQNDHIPGTGLGLYLARELARLHGGDITVVSRPGGGSTFTLTLPLAAD